MVVKQELPVVSSENIDGWTEKPYLGFVNSNKIENPYASFTSNLLVLS